MAVALKNVLERQLDPNDILLQIKFEDPAIALYIDTFLSGLPSAATRGAALTAATTIWAAFKEQEKLDNAESI